LGIEVAAVRADFRIIGRCSGALVARSWKLSKLLPLVFSWRCCKPRVYDGAMR
jgi:hypothetical protein